MLSKINRLSRQAFLEVKKVGQKIYHKEFLILYIPSSIFKSSVVVSKKINTKAVYRNRLRRKIYEYLKFHHSNSKISIIIYPQKNETDITILNQVLPKLS